MSDVLHITRPLEGVDVITMNRPNVLNALDDTLVDALDRALDQVATDPSSRVTVLTGSGRGFCAGHDMGDLDEQARVRPTPEEAYRVQVRYAQLVQKVAEHPQPIVGAINGVAAGGGFALALACDTRVASTSARFNAAFVKLALVGTDLGLSFLLPRAIGTTHAFELMLSGRMLEAEEAKQLGLVLDVVPDGTVVEAAGRIAARIRVNHPFGLLLTKQTMWRNLGAPSLAAAMDLENRAQALCLLSEEHQASVDSFLTERNRLRRSIEEKT